MSNEPEIEWPEDYFARREIETPDKGWLDVVVRLPNGARHQLCFYDLARVAQALSDARANNQTCFGEPSLVLVDEVNTAVILDSVVELFRTGFFERLTLPRDDR